MLTVPTVSTYKKKQVSIDVGVQHCVAWLSHADIASRVNIAHLRTLRSHFFASLGTPASAFWAIDDPCIALGARIICCFDCSCPPLVVDPCCQMQSRALWDVPATHRSQPCICNDVLHAGPIRSRPIVAQEWLRSPSAATMLLRRPTRSRRAIGVHSDTGNGSISSNSSGSSVARKILSSSTLEGGSMLPFLAVSEAYWKVCLWPCGNMATTMMLPWLACLVICRRSQARAVATLHRQ